jgi:hypothetical protein
MTTSTSSFKNVARILAVFSSAFERQSTGTLCEIEIDEDGISFRHASCEFIKLNKNKIK